MTVLAGTGLPHNGIGIPFAAADANWASGAHVDLEVAFPLSLHASNSRWGRYYHWI